MPQLRSSYPMTISGYETTFTCNVSHSSIRTGEGQELHYGPIPNNIK